jgi:hypothetical protein
MKTRGFERVTAMKTQESTYPLEVLHTQQVTTLSQQKQST